MRRKITAGLLGLALVAILIPITSSPAAAAGLINCSAAGVIDQVSTPGTTTWTGIGAGSCFGDLEGTYILPDLAIAGTSDSLGICDSSLVVTNLDLKVSGNLINISNPLQNKSLAGKSFEAPVSTFPVVTPFLVNEGGSPIGAGVLFTRIFGKCPAAGTPVFNLDFAFTT